MRMMCKERDQLWLQYDEALLAYSDAVLQTVLLQATGRHVNFSEALAVAGEKRLVVEDLKAIVELHCGAHGCEK